ncbi:MAG: preprotein translocase subunit SecE [Cardiobacteriaceae bacterium]|nr:preprotein translocase subunit SecE [Cardiobacteriaceae bacterium]
MQQAPVEIEKKPLDGVLIFLATLLFLGGFYLAGSLFFAAKPWYIRLLIIVVAIVSSLAVLALSSYRARLFSLARGARIELRKVHWPSKDEWWKATLMVLVIVTVFALFLSLIDWLLAALIQWVL